MLGFYIDVWLINIQPRLPEKVIRMMCGMHANDMLQMQTKWDDIFTFIVDYNIFFCSELIDLPCPAGDGSKNPPIR